MRFIIPFLVVIILFTTVPPSITTDSLLKATNSGAVETRLSNPVVEVLGYDGNMINFSIFVEYVINNTGAPTSVTTPCSVPKYNITVTGKFSYSMYKDLSGPEVCLTVMTTHDIDSGVYERGNFTIPVGLTRGSYLIYYYNELASKFYGIRIQVINSFKGEYLIYEDVSVEPEPFTDFPAFLEQYVDSPVSTQSELVLQYIQWQSLYGFPAIINNTAVAFIYYVKQGGVSQVILAGDFNGWAGEEMIRLDSSISFFYKILRFNSTARVDYKFVVDGQWILDPRNHYTMPGGFGDNSELAMPKFKQPSEVIYRKNIPHGVVKTFSTSFSNFNPKVNIYLPPAYNDSVQYPVAYFTDGTEYRMFASAINILDNLIYEKKIVPVIGVFIDPWQQRHEWYNCSSPSYLSYIEQLVPLIEESYPINSSLRLHLGDSLGGQISLYVGIKRPDLFPLIGVHSGAFWDGDTSLGRIGCSIKDQFRDMSSSPQLNIWMVAGYFETEIASDTKLVSQYIDEKGWESRVLYLHEGHSWGLWRHTLVDMLEYFFPSPVQKEITVTSISSSTLTQTSDLSDIDTASNSSTTPLQFMWVILLIPLVRKKRRRARL